MSQTLHLHGFILVKRDQGESDRIISFYSREVGKIEILVKGMRKINSKLAPLLAEPFTLLELVVVQGKTLRLIGGQKKQRFPKILKEERKLMPLNVLFQQINKLIKPQPDDKIFSLLYKFLKIINNSKEEKILVIINAFLIKFLSFLGYRPEIRKCLICGALPQSQELFFNFSKGGIICLKHNQFSSLNKIRKKEFIKITTKDWQILQKLLYQDFNSLLNQFFSHYDLKRVEILIKKFFIWHLE